MISNLLYKKVNYIRYGAFFLLLLLNQISFGQIEISYSKESKNESFRVHSFSSKVYDDGLKRGYFHLDISADRKNLSRIEQLFLNESYVEKVSVFEKDRVKPTYVVFIEGFGDITINWIQERISNALVTGNLQTL